MRALHLFVAYNIFIICTVHILIYKELEVLKDDDNVLTVSDVATVCLGCLLHLFRCLMNDCNLLKWAGWPQRL